MSMVRSKVAEKSIELMGMHTEEVLARLRQTQVDTKQLLDTLAVQQESLEELQKIIDYVKSDPHELNKCT